MIYSLYSISLKLKTPSERGKKVDFRELETDLFEALDEFNTKYRSWSKRVILTDIQKNFFTILLLIEKHKDKISTREIRSFTAYLNKEKNWKVFSRESTKLFEGIRFSRLSLEEAKNTITHINENKSDPFYKHQEEDILFLMNTKSQLTPKEINEENSHKFSYVEDLSDEQAIAIFNYLLKTKELGSNHEEKKETILQIKDMLVKWL